MTTEAEQDNYNEDEEAQVSKSDIDNDDPDDEADFVGGTSRNKNLRPMKTV